jgi:DNA invertase Pin-like site-specific DNA recombinase
MSVAIYARVSDDKKKEDGERRQDVNRQVEIIREHLRRKGIQEWEEYIDDAKSAFTEDWNQRPDFKRLFNDCRRHFIKEIYIEDMTRFSRRLDIGLPLLKELGELNVQLISLRDGEIEVTSAKGWLQSSILLMFAEWDSRIKAEKVRSGMKKAKNLGKKIGGFRGGRKPTTFSEGKNRLKKASLKTKKEGNK